MVGLASPATIHLSEPEELHFECDHIGHTFTGDRGGVEALRDVTFGVGVNEFVCIVGPSGCGKSTLLRVIAELLVPTEGAVIFGRAGDHGRHRTGLVFQDHGVFPWMTVLDNVAFGLECRGVPASDRRERAREWIRKVGLDVDRDAAKYPHQLSGGMRQRVAIARTLILNPRIILMDEPFGALDPSTRLRMQDMLVSLSREAQATVFFVTHSIEEAVYLGDRTYVFSSCPGTILKELAVPAPDFPAKQMQRRPEFMEIVFEIRDMVESLESSTRAGDE